MLVTEFTLYAYGLNVVYKRGITARLVRSPQYSFDVVSSRLVPLLHIIRLTIRTTPFRGTDLIFDPLKHKIRSQR